MPEHEPLTEDAKFDIIVKGLLPHLLEDSDSTVVPGPGWGSSRVRGFNTLDADDMRHISLVEARRLRRGIGALLFGRESAPETHVIITDLGEENVIRNYFVNEDETKVVRNLPDGSHKVGPMTEEEKRLLVDVFWPMRDEE